MPRLERDNGVQIHWEERGAGPLVLVSPNPNVTMPSNYDALLSDLAADHRVVTWDPRGTGGSTDAGPYDLATDAADMAALIDELGGAPVAVAVGLSPAALVLVDSQPDAVAAVVLVGALPPLGPSADGDGESLLDSGGVAAAAREMLRTNPRALLRTMMSLGNPQLDEAGIQERVDAQLRYSPATVTATRGEAFLTYDGTRPCKSLGERLWVVHWDNPMSPDGAVHRVRALLPQAHVVEVEEGALSRPDLTAAAVRAATRAAGVA
jgi:pimeloyl-ACP methyl ester carboxylesterase